MRGVARAVCALLALMPAAGAARRPFPDTRDCIRVYVDQLPSQITDAQWRFVATHYVGSQKMPRSWTRHARRLNPNFLMLHYQLAVGLGPAASYTEDILTNQTQPPTPLFTDVAAIQRDWLPSLNRYGAFCAQGFHAQTVPSG